MKKICSNKRVKKSSQESGLYLHLLSGKTETEHRKKTPVWNIERTVKRLMTHMYVSDYKDWKVGFLILCFYPGQGLKYLINTL